MENYDNYCWQYLAHILGLPGNHNSQFSILNSPFSKPVFHESLHGLIACQS